MKDDSGRMSTARILASFVLVGAISVGLAVWVTGVAAEAADADSPGAEIDRGAPTGEAATASPLFSAGTVPKIELDEPVRLFEHVDRAFATVVDWLETIFFYRLGAHSQDYVVYQAKEYYVRERSSEDAFHKLVVSGLSKADLLDTDAVAALAAQGKLVRGSDGRNYRFGKIGATLVDYVTVIRDDKEKQLTYGSKYVFDETDQLFHKVLPKRSLLSPNVTLTPSEVDVLGRQGRLRQDPGSAEQESKPFLLTETAGGAPLVVLWLACGAVFFTLYLQGFNIWGFRHAIQIVLGKYDNPNEAGEVTHFQALASALSATVGLGNIAGVTIAMTLGGPGAFFWMICCGVFGMASKFMECTLGQKYRLVKPDGTVLGGPMRYLRAGLEEMHLGGLGVVLSLAFSVMCILASFGGGTMFQANQSGTAVLALLQRGDAERRSDLDVQIRNAAAASDIEKLGSLQQEKTRLNEEMTRFEHLFRGSYGALMALLVAVVIIGGIRRISAAAEKVVPSMCLMYSAACLWIILNHLDEVPQLIASILDEAFTGEAMGGGLVGVLVVGVQRAAFSNEAGIGSAAIAHSAAKTDEPIREGCVAMLGPFIDTVVVCSMTALVILITGAWDRSDWIVDEGLQGAALTSRAFGNEISWFPWLLSVAVVLFAYSTMISWSYYGERSWEFLFGSRSTIVYKVLVISCVFLGSIAHLGAVLDFSDMMILSMALPNVLGVVLLAPRVKRDLSDYWRRYRANEFRTFK
jgi:AGCS family alanine or glycine:cation symporter